MMIFMDSVFTSLMLGVHTQFKLMDNVYLNFRDEDADHIIIIIIIITLLLFTFTLRQVQKTHLNNINNRVHVLKCV